jgi:hypothetical protein
VAFVIYEVQKIAACGSSYRGPYSNIGNYAVPALECVLPVGAAEGCDLLTF